MSALSEQEGKALILARLRQAMVEMPASERERPRYILNFQAYSVLDLIKQVEQWTPTGKKYTFQELKRLNYIVT